MKIAFEIKDELAPAFRSAVDEFSSFVGARLTKPHRAPTERAITQAVAAIGALRAAVTQAMPRTSRDYAN